MARIRTIKPDFYSSGKQLRLSIEAAYLLPCLWVNADDEGRMIDDPLEIGARCPRLIKRIDKLLTELSVSGWLTRYEVSGKRYIQIHDWKDHQHINRPTSSKIPALSSYSVIPHGELSESSVNTHGGKEGKGKEGKGKEGKGSNVEQSSTTELVDEIFEFWKQELFHPKSTLDGKRKKAISSRLREGYTVDRIKQAIRGIKKSPHNMGQNDRNTVYDDIELICRSGANVDRFADMDDRKTLHQIVNISRYQRAGLNPEVKND